MSFLLPFPSRFEMRSSNGSKKLSLIGTFCSMNFSSGIYVHFDRFFRLYKFSVIDYNILIEEVGTMLKVHPSRRVQTIVVLHFPGSRATIFYV